MQHTSNMEKPNLAKLWTIIEGEINLERGKLVAMIQLEFQKATGIRRKQNES